MINFLCSSNNLILRIHIQKVLNKNFLIEAYSGITKDIEHIPMISKKLYYDEFIPFYNEENNILRTPLILLLPTLIFLAFHEFGYKEN